MSRLRLLKIDMRPVFVLDDGETLTEQAGEPFTVQAASITTFSEDWSAEMLRLQAEHE